MDEQIAPMLLMRLKPRLSNGAMVGESQRECHLVALPASGQGPEVLRAYCGVEIVPDSWELLHRVTGMPCQLCLARSPIPVFSMLRTLPIAAGEGPVTEPGGWSDHGLTPEQRLAARFVLLLLLQHPARSVSVAEIADRLGLDPETVNVIVLMHVAVGWVQRWWAAPEGADRGWTDCLCRLTEQGATLARRLLDTHLSTSFTTFADLADRLDLDLTVITERDQAPEGDGDGSGPGGCNGVAPAAPTGHQHDSADEGEES